MFEKRKISLVPAGIWKLIRIAHMSHYTYRATRLKLIKDDEEKWVFLRSFIGFTPQTLLEWLKEQNKKQASREQMVIQSELRAESVTFISRLMHSIIQNIVVKIYVV